MKTRRLEITCALIGQVQNALRGSGQNENAVTTVITRPMWRGFLREIGENPNQEPNELNGHAALRVYGSRTLVVEQEGMASFSFLRNKENTHQ